MQLYKGVFSPEQDHSLAFIGFIQPASGGLTSMSEIQARWWAELCRGTVKLPSKAEMKESISKELVGHGFPEIPAHCGNILFTVIVPQSLVSFGKAHNPKGPPGLL